LQHDQVVEFFGGQKGFEERQRHDKIKNAFCDDQDIMLYRVKSYEENVAARVDAILDYNLY
jgi:hypothetical protein